MTDGMAEYSHLFPFHTTSPTSITKFSMLSPNLDKKVQGFHFSVPYDRLLGAKKRGKKKWEGVSHLRYNLKKPYVRQGG
jgi:hypothetical protein